MASKGSSSKLPIDEPDASNVQERPSSYLNPLYGQHPIIQQPMGPRANINQPNWRFTPNPVVGGEPSGGKVRRSRGETVESVVSVPGNMPGGNQGVVRATEILRNMNGQGEGSRRGSESEDERTSRSVSRRSSGGDSGVNLSEGEMIENDVPDSGTRRQPPRRPDFPKDESNTSYSSVPMAGLPLVGAMFGLCLGGPVGLLAGAKLGGVAAVGGSILGYTSASVIKDQRELRGYIDEHYKKEPELYVLSPREEAILNRRRMSDRTPPDGTRHLPSLHRSGSLYKKGPAGYRRPSAAGSCSSSGSSPAARRRAQSFRHTKSLRKKPPSNTAGNETQKPPNLSRGQYRRLGDLTEEEQRSVLALLCSQGELQDRTFAVSSHVCDIHPGCEQQVLISQGAAVSPAVCATPSPWSGRPAEEKRRILTARVRARTSSLPDVLEEDSISVKSFNMNNP